MSRIDLEAIEGVHKGTGSHTTRKLLVDPSSVSGSEKLIFFSKDVHITTMLYQLDTVKAPNWFGVAVPDGVTDFSRPIIYFHPTPNQGPYSDSDYATKGESAGNRNWHELFEYVDRLGHQLAGAVMLAPTIPAIANQILILPFMTTASSVNAGILPANWLAIVTDILKDVRATITGTGGPLTLSEVVVSSFSNGFTYSDVFRKNAIGLSGLLKEVWDFDGFPKPLSNALVSKPGLKVVKYDQINEPGSIHLPGPHWDNYPLPPPNEEPSLRDKSDPSFVHHLIRDFMFLDAATKR